MQINLKQAEIKKALELYIGQQGIQLAGKDVSIRFTAGRGETGLTADILITATDLPDFGDEEVGAVAPAVAKLALVSNNPETPVVDLASVPQGASFEPEVIEVVAEKPLKTASLFS